MQALIKLRKFQRESVVANGNIGLLGVLVLRLCCPV